MRGLGTAISLLRRLQLRLIFYQSIPLFAWNFCSLSILCRLEFQCISRRFFFSFFPRFAPIPALFLAFLTQVGLLSTPPSSGLAVTDPVFANYWKVPYVALAAAHYVSEIPAILGGRDSLVIVRMLICFLSILVTSLCVFVYSMRDSMNDSPFSFILVSQPLIGTLCPFLALALSFAFSPFLSAFVCDSFHSHRCRRKSRRTTAQ